LVPAREGDLLVEVIDVTRNSEKGVSNDRGRTVNGALTGSFLYGFLDGIGKLAIKAVGNATGLVIKIISFHAEGVRF